VARIKNAATVTRSEVLSALAEKAIDLGPVGKDPIYDFGAIQRQ
jgi:hypothetical protein